MFKTLEFEFNMLDSETRYIINFSAKMGKSK
jgi:hypothetical protein